MNRSYRAFKTLSLATVVLAFLFAACNPVSNPQTSLSAAGEPAGMIRNLFMFIFWIAVGVFAIVEGLLLYSVIRFRRRPGQEVPVQTHGNNGLEIAWTIAPTLILVVIAVPTIQMIFKTYNPPKAEALDVRVIGHQWWWEFQYSGLNFTTANELHVPVGKVVKVTLESADVIHSWGVPRLAGRRDNIPNRVNTIWLQADQAGEFPGQCYELCGIAHSYMKFLVVAQSDAEFNAWVKGQQQVAAAPTDAHAARGAQLFTAKQCFICHTIAGTSARGTIGPNLTHFSMRKELAAGVLTNTPENLALWLKDPNSVKPGNVMSRDGPPYRVPALALTTEDIEALVGYLSGLK